MFNIYAEQLWYPKPECTRWGKFRDESAQLNECLMPSERDDYLIENRVGISANKKHVESPFVRFQISAMPTETKACSLSLKNVD